jgi:uncharacterized protein YbaR (Trm112 family)
VVADTANGMGGLVVPAVFEALPFDLEVMYGELDGTFPNHPADPIQPENQRDLRARVSRWAPMSASPSTATPTACSWSTNRASACRLDHHRHPRRGRARKPPRRHQVLHNLICSKAVPEVVREHGGVPVRTKVGHSFIKAVMAETGAVFGGEHSAHYYFRDNFRADSGLIAACSCSSSSAARVPVGAAQAVRALRRLGEINTQGRGPGGHRAGGRGLRRPRPGPARRPHRRLRRLVVQPAPLEHRAAAAPEPRGRLYNPRLRRWYDIRDGIPVMLIDEARSVSAAEHKKLLALAAERGLDAAEPAGSGAAGE